MAVLFWGIDLPVSLAKVDSGQVLVSTQLVEQVSSRWHWLWVNPGQFVQLPVVYPYPVRVIFLFDNHY